MPTRYLYMQLHMYAKVPVGHSKILIKLEKDLREKEIADFADIPAGVLFCFHRLFP